MQCMSFGAAWENNLHQLGAESSPLQEDCVSLRLSQSQRLNSACASFSSDSDTSMAQDSDEALNLHQWLSEVMWEESYQEVGDSISTAACSNVFENSIEPSSTPQSCTPPSAYRPYTETPPFCYATLNNMQPHSTQPQNYYQTQSPASDLPHSSSSSNFSLDWPTSPLESQPLADFNEIEMSDSEDEIETDKRYRSENVFQHFPARHQELPTIRTMLGEKNQNRSQNHYQRQTHVHEQSPAYIQGGAHRPRQRSVKQPILSHFIYHALEHPNDYDSMIRWVNRAEGIFEFSSKNKESLARAWGMVKNNRRSMTYPKMARALRKYIENGRVLKKLKNRLRYVFLEDFLNELRSGNEPKQLSSVTIRQMYEYSRLNQGR